jgi:hypothetical protein
VNSRVAVFDQHPGATSLLLFKGIAIPQSNQTTQDKQLTPVCLGDPQTLGLLA